MTKDILINNESNGALVIEDELMVAEHIMTCLEMMKIAPIHFANTVDQISNCIKTHRPWLIVCDVNLGQPLDGIQLMQIHRNHHPFILIYLTAFGNFPTVQRALATNPDFYLLKPFTNSQLQIIIRQAFDKWLRIQKSDPLILKPPTTPNPLSKREQEVLELVHKGLLSKEIAYVLQISETTAQTHRKHLLEKCNCNNTHEAVYLALKNGWLQ